MDLPPAGEQPVLAPSLNDLPSSTSHSNGASLIDVPCDNRPSVIGSLRKKSQFWLNSLKTSGLVRAVLKNGFVIPILAKPTECSRRNNLSARQNNAFVKSEIQNLLRTGAIKLLPSKPSLLNPLTVAFSKSNKPRVVLDL